MPDYSNRDAIYIDLAAPGDNIFSTIPLSLAQAGCADGPYSDCGPLEFRDAIGTSFAAPQVAAAAALLLGQDPKLRPEQVAWLLERSADDESAANGLPAVPPRAGPAHRLGPARHPGGSDRPQPRARRCRRRTGSSRTTTPGRARTRFRRCRGRSRRRSTTGTTRSTSTASPLQKRPAAVRPTLATSRAACHAAHALAARDEAGRGARTSTSATGSCSRRAPACRSGSPTRRGSPARTTSR